ncbi:putative soluble epoxide hydrolase [Lupinus albus]|uniref:Putative soluble epoxide hydrolase n=1 Tax=Lupinus albus TaxID=3870 RepID=A0A6A4PMA2_LUPAL|nr:putative soluble epoxide hydrolase [Lupinus albus]
MEVGDIESEFSQIGTERVLKEFLTYSNPGPLYLAKGKGFGNPIDSPITLPSWLPEEEFNYYVTKYNKTGFTGAMNYYRNLDLNWELTAPWTSTNTSMHSFQNFKLALGIFLLYMLALFLSFAASFFSSCGLWILKLGLLTEELSKTLFYRRESGIIYTIP